MGSGGNILDTFFVELGIDPSKFNKGQKEAVENFKRTQEELSNRAKRVEESTKPAADAIGTLKRQAIGMFAALMGASSVKDFVQKTVSADTAVGRLSRNIGASVGTLARWQAAAQLFGGSADAMAGTFKRISDELAGFKAGIPSQLVAEFRSVSAAAETIAPSEAKIIDVTKDVNSVLIDLADNLKIIHDLDPAKAGLFQSRLGLDPAFFDLLVQGGSKVRETLNSVAAATDANAQAADRLQKRWNSMTNEMQSWGRTMLTGLESPLTKTMDWISRQFRESAIGYKDIFGGYEPMSGRGLLAEKMRENEAKRRSETNNGTGGGSGSFSGAAEKEAFIRAEAVKRGINPDVAVAVAKSEGFYSYSGDMDATGKPTSFGSYQLHYAGVGRNTASGLGEIFSRQTGLDARDPATERRQIEFALDWAKTHGWSDWHGWRGPQFAGIDRAGGSTSSTKIEINGPININAGQNADGRQMASSFRDELLRRQAGAAQANTGQQ